VLSSRKMSDSESGLLALHWCSVVCDDSTGQAALRTGACDKAFVPDYEQGSANFVIGVLPLVDAPELLGGNAGLIWIAERVIDVGDAIDLEGAIDVAVAVDVNMRTQLAQLCLHPG